MTIIGSTNSSAWTYKLEVTETSTSIANRTSTIQVKTYIGRANSRSYIGGNYTNSVSITGVETQIDTGTIPYPTYINGGEWYELKTFTFTVSNTGNPTTISISSELSSSVFTPSSSSASGNMDLTILHLSPEINIATMVETNQAMITLGVPDTTIVRYLSKKTITLNATAYDSATLSYRIRHYNTDYALPSINTYQASPTFNTDYTQNDVTISSGKAQLIQNILDSMGGSNTDWLYVTINGNKEKPNGIEYTKPNLERTSTSIKRKSGNGTNLTDNKANLNLVGNIYKENDIIGNNNIVTQVGYKIWEDNDTEPVNYTSLNATISGGNITVTDYEISNIDFTKIYNYKIILADNYGYNYVVEGIVPLGQSTWTEYKDRVDFLKLTVNGYNPFEYSTSETKCGIWIDGKPLYRKVINTDALVGNDVTIAHNISNVDIIYVANAFFIDSSSDITWSVPTNLYGITSTGTDRINTFVTKTEVGFKCDTTWPNYWNKYIVLEYTKTTD